MRLFLLTSITMIAFASNSVLTRMAVEPGHIDPVSFTLLRVLSGATFLCGLVWINGTPLKWRGHARWIGAVSLSIYMIGFSLAYISLNAGLGALILFGVVQISMFSYSTFVGSRPTPRQLIGAVIAFSGLVVALWPSSGTENGVQGAGFMVLAGLGWAAYTLSGKNARNPLAETAANFAICLPILILLTLPFIRHASAIGVVLALLCGAVTSGLGYALWYTVLPGLQRNVAAIVQLCVPIIAILAGSLLLGEQVTPIIVAAAGLVVVGIWLAATKRSAPKDHS